jgi:hypothetical protein
MIIALSGLCFDKDGNMCSAGAGKDTVADRLVAKHDFVKVGLADPLKRFVQETFYFSDEQVWGVSGNRNRVDLRYAREQHVLDEKDGTCACCGAVYYEERGWAPKSCYLTPRYALKLLGTEWGRHCYDPVWINLLLRVHSRLQMGGHYYDQRTGLRPWSSVGDTAMSAKKNIVVSDLRFKNELARLREYGAITVRIRRPLDHVKTTSHASENDLLDVPDSAFDLVLHGKTKDVPDLQRQTDLMANNLQSAVSR